MFGKKVRYTGNMKSSKQIGEILGMSAQQVNKLLLDKGFLSGKPGDYTVTAKGKPYAEIRQKGNGYGGYAARSWEFVMWDEVIIHEICDLRFPGIDWFCDECKSFLNEQKGFTDKKGSWKCTNCGHKNIIDESEIIR